MKKRNIEKSSAEVCEYIEKLIVDVPAPADSEINKSIEKILVLSFGKNTADNSTV